MRVALVILLCLMAPPAFASDGHKRGDALMDPEMAMRISQDAIGTTLGNYHFESGSGDDLYLADLRGKPYIINFIYTSCAHTCPMIVQNVEAAVEAAEDAFGDGKFEVLTIGFDVANDSPQRMADYASARGISNNNWHFLSANRQTITALAGEAGFLFMPIAGGFDHLAQVSVVDEAGVLYRQVYGEAFPVPALVEPLKQLVYGRKSGFSSFDGLWNQVKLFCTIYDPNKNAYRFDYSLIISIFTGVACLSGIGWVLVRNLRRNSGRAA